MTKPNLQNKLLDVLCEHLGDQAICSLDEQGNITEWNAASARFYHLSADGALDQYFSTLFDEPDVHKVLSTALSQGKYESEWRLKRYEGDKARAYVSIQPLYDSELLQGYSLYSRLLIYNKKAGGTLIDQASAIDQVSAPVHTNSLFQQLIENSHSGISLFDADLNFIYRSPSAVRITGFTNTDRADASVNEIIHPADQPQVKILLDELLEAPGTSCTCVFRARHYEGHFIYLDCVFTNWLNAPGIEAIVLNFSDVTDQQQVQYQLTQAINELSAYRYALDEAAIVAITDQRGKITHVNDYFCRISGYTREELLGQDHRLINSGFHPKEFIRELWETIAQGKIWRGELRNKSKDGSYYWVATTLVPFLNNKGKPYQYIAIRYDITDVKLVDEALQRTSSRLSNLLESINDGFIALDKNLQYTYVNLRVCNMVGIKAEDMLGRYIWDLFPNAVGSATYHAIEQALKTKSPVVHEDYYPPLRLWQENRIYPNEDGLTIFISDITARKEAELQQQLLNDIGKIFTRQEVISRLLQDALSGLLTFSDAVLAEAWLKSADAGQLFLVAAATADPDLAKIFHVESANRIMAANEGLPGITWQKRRIEIWENISQHPDFTRKSSAQQAGITDAIGVPLFDGEEIIGVLLLGLRSKPRDIVSEPFLRKLSELLGAEIRRKELKQEIQRVFESVPDIICIVGTDRRYKRVNPAMSVLLGYTEEELLHKQIDDLIHPDDLEESLRRMRRFIDGEIEVFYFENRYRTKDHRVIHLAWTVRKAAEKGILFCVAKDVSEKKRLEELLQKSSELARIGSWELDPDTGAVYWSPVVREVLEVSADYEMEWLKAKLFCTPDVLEKINSAISSLITDKKTFDIETEVFTAKGNIRWVRILGEGEFLGSKCIRIYGSFQDIDSRKRVDMKLLEQAEELAASGRRYSELFHISPLPMFVFDLETLAYLDVNEAAMQQYGYSREEFLSMTIRDIRPSSEMEKLKEVLINEHRSDYQHRPGIFTHIKKGGQEIQVEIVSSALQYLGRPARLALAQDVTERNRHLTEIKAQNQKLRDISWMQSHVIRAPLSRIMGLVNLMKSTEPDTDTMAEIIDYIQLSAAELDQVVQDIAKNAGGGTQNLGEILG